MRELVCCCAQRAIKAGVTSSLQVYASAIGACKSSRSANLDAALQVYSDMQRCASLYHGFACLSFLL